MIRLRRFASRLDAEHAAAFLRRRGAPVVVVGDYVNTMFGGLVAPKMLQVELMLLDPGQRERAEALLTEFDSVPIELDPDWEDESCAALAGADLSVCDLRCPNCRCELAVSSDDPERAVCPACGKEYDVLELIVARDGPEALDAFGVTDEVTPMTPATPRPRPARCRECRADITMLPTRGRCPHCGRLFDKDHEP